MTETPKSDRCICLFNQMTGVGLKLSYLWFGTVLPWGSPYEVVMHYNPDILEYVYYTWFQLC